MILTKPTKRIAPKPGEFWRHCTGELYQIVALTTAGECPYPDSPAYLTCLHTKSEDLYEAKPAPGAPGISQEDDRIWLWPQVDYSCVLYRAVKEQSTRYMVSPLNEFLEVLGRTGKGNNRWYRFYKVLSPELRAKWIQEGLICRAA